MPPPQFLCLPRACPLLQPWVGFRKAEKCGGEFDRLLLLSPHQGKARDLSNSHGKRLFSGSSNPGEGLSCCRLNILSDGCTGKETPPQCMHQQKMPEAPFTPPCTFLTCLGPSSPMHWPTSLTGCHHPLTHLTALLSLVTSATTTWSPVAAMGGERRRHLRFYTPRSSLAFPVLSLHRECASSNFCKGELRSIKVTICKEVQLHILCSHSVGIENPNEILLMGKMHLLIYRLV